LRSEKPLRRVRDAYQIGRDGYKMRRDAYKTVRDGYKTVRDGYKMVRDGYKMVRDGYKMGRDGYKIVRDGYKMVRDGYKMRRDGDQMIRDGYQMRRVSKLTARNWRAQGHFRFTPGDRVFSVQQGVNPVDLLEEDKQSQLVLKREAGGTTPGQPGVNLRLCNR